MWGNESGTYFLKKHSFSSVYITWLYVVVMYIVPFTCLAAFNLKIYQQVI